MFATDVDDACEKRGQPAPWALKTFCGNAVGISGGLSSKQEVGSLRRTLHISVGAFSSKIDAAAAIEPAFDEENLWEFVKEES